MPRDVSLPSQLKGRSQKCPNCKRVEAAGFYCSGCGTQTGQSFWVRRVEPPLIKKNHRVRERKNAKVVKS